MSVSFISENHKYQSIDPTDPTEWMSVTSVISQFKQKFDAETQSVKSSKNKKSKWYGLDPQTIQKLWKFEADRATDLGTFYHNEREADLMVIDSIERSGRPIPIIKPIIEGMVKYAPDQRLTEGIYPEHFVYLKSAGVCGQSDRVEVVSDTVDIIDYKTNKEIKFESFKSWDGVSQKMTGPLSHLDDCNANHYAVQLSMYMYMILKHNPRLKPGKIQIHHIVFEEVGKDTYGYPVTKYDADGKPIVKEVIVYDLPYLKQEVIQVINWMHDNKESLTKK